MKLRPITLVGLPGVGKSTIGRQLARRLELPFFDSDELIEQCIGQSIRSFFEEKGEDAFRDLEEEVLDRLSLKNNCVIATGGGIVLREVNRHRLMERARVIYLRATPEQLIKRLRHDMKRPLLQGSNPLARLRSLYEVREPLYRETAEFVMEACVQSKSLLVSRLLMQLELLAEEGDALGER